MSKLLLIAAALCAIVAIVAVEAVSHTRQHSTAKQRGHARWKGDDDVASR